MKKNILFNILFLLIFFSIAKAQELEVSRPPGVVVNHMPKYTAKDAVGSPSICILPNGDYLVSYDSWKGTSICVSKDQGETWELLSIVSPLVWANIFEHNGAVYLMGTSTGWSNIVIYRSADNGNTWSQPVDSTTGIIAEGLFHTAPVPIVKYKGKIWRAYEEVFDPTKRRNLHALAICADENADLLNASSWTRTNSIRFDESWINASDPYWLEGNLVVTSDNKLVDFMRLQTWSGTDISYEIEGAAQGKPRNEIAAIIDVNDENMTMEFDNDSGNFVHFPGAEIKFTIRYDSVSMLYWTITNKISSFKNTEGVYNGNWHQRNVLVLMSSPDLKNWQIREKLLRWNEGAHLKEWDTFGFQYVDWVFENNDIAFVSRTSWYGPRYHDANVITFHRIEDFRTTNNNNEPEDLINYTNHPELMALTNERLIEGTLVLDDFDLNIQYGEGLKRNVDGSFALKGPDANIRAVNEAEALSRGRYFDIHISSDSTSKFSLETIVYTPISNFKGVKLKWFYSIDSATFLPITNYWQHVDNVPGVTVEPESTMYLLVYDALNRINARKGVTLRCVVIGAHQVGATLRFEEGISLGGRKFGGNLNAHGLLNWYFNAADGHAITNGRETSMAARVVDGNLENSQLVRGAGLEINPTAYGRSFMAKFKYIAPTYDNSKDYAFDHDAYFEFTVQPKTGTEATLTQLDYKVRSGSNGPYGFRWAYSTDNWVTHRELGDVGGIKWINSPDTVGVGNADGSVNYSTSSPEGFIQTPIDLSREAALANIAASKKIIFRLYIWGATNATTSTFCIGASSNISTPDVVLSVSGSTTTILPDSLLSSVGINPIKPSANNTIESTLSPRKELIVNNVLTPNLDGKNDNWMIQGLDDYKNNEVKVFDRQGRLIYSKKGYMNDWDGTYNGSILPQGGYYYIVEINDGKKIMKLTGVLTIFK